MRVFVSYAHQDATRAHQLADHIDRIGHEAFIDRKMEAGTTIRTRLEDELRHADCVAVLWTKASVKARWVLEEATLASSIGTLRTVRFVVLPPFGFREQSAPKLKLRATAAEVAHALGIPAAAEATPPVATTPSEKSPDEWFAEGSRLSRWITRTR